MKRKKSFHLGRVFKILLLVLAFLYLLHLFSGSSFAATGINRQINFQGKLANTDGTNVTDGNYTVVFSLYNVSSGGTALWTETQTVSTTNGIFKVALGSVTAIPSNFNFNWDGLYLGIKVGSDAEMTPRIQMTAAPFAFNAQQVAGLTVQDSSGNASTSGTLQIPNAKTVSFADAFSYTGTGGLTFTNGSASTVTVPTGTITLADLTSTQTFGSGKTWNGALIGLQYGGTGANLTTGAVVGAIPYLTSTSAMATLDPTNHSGSCLVSQGAGAAPQWGTCGTGGGGGATYWSLNSNGVITPVNETVDLLLGGVSTSSARFAVLNVNSGTPIASVSAGTSGGAYLSAAGTLATTAKQSLTLGDTNTGNIVLNGFSNAGGVLYTSATGAISQTGTSISSQCLTGGASPSWVDCTTASNAMTNPMTAAGDLIIGEASGDQNLALNSLGITTTADSVYLGNVATNATDGSDSTSWDSNSHFSASGGTAPWLEVDFGSAKTIKEFRLDQAVSATNNNATQFEIESSSDNSTWNLVYTSPTAQTGDTGTVSISTTTARYWKLIALSGNPSDGWVVYSFELKSGGVSAGTPTRLGVGIAGQILGVSGGLPAWINPVMQENLGAVEPFNITDDLLLGATATTSAKFGFLNVAGGTPVASISAGTSGGVYLNATGTLATTALQSLTLGDGNTGNINIGIDATARTISMGNATGATALNFTSGTGSQTFTSSATSNNAFAFVANSLNTGNGLNLTGNGTGLTSGSLLNLAFTGNSAFTGALANFNWSPTSTTTATGDVFDVSVGSNSNTNGTVSNILNVLNGGSSVFSVSQTQVTSALPFNETTPGDAGFSYDINLTNPVISNIKSQSVLALTAGESFNSSDLQLNTYNLGSVIANAAGGFQVQGGNGTGNAAAIINQLGNGDLFTASNAGTTKFVISSSGNVGIGTAAPHSVLDVTGTGGTTLFETDVIASVGNGASGTGSNAVANTIGDQGSMVPNAGFESAAVGTTFADGWVRDGTSSATITRDTASPAKGTGDAKIVLTNTTAAIYSACIPISGVAGAYTLNWYQKGVSPFATVGGYIDGYTSKANCQSNTTPTISTTAMVAVTTASWVKKGSNTTAVAGIASTTTWARVHFVITCASSCTNSTTQIDGVRLTESTLGNGLDIAEAYPANPTDIPQSGDVVMLDSAHGTAFVKKADVAQDPSVLGVISTNPGETLDDGSVPDPKVYVALSGRVPVHVSTQNGPIHLGDYLMSSSIPGVAVKATTAGQVIGIAMEDMTDPNTTDVNSITMFIKNTYYSGGQQSPDLQFVGSLASAASQSSTNAVSTGQLATQGLVETSPSQIVQNTATATSSATLSANNINGLNEFVDAIVHKDVLGIATSSAQIDAIKDGLLVMGPSTFEDTTVTGTLNVDSSMNIAQGAINVLGSDLALQPLAQGGISFVGGLVRIDTDGTLNVAGKAIFDGETVFNQLTSFVGETFFKSSVFFASTPYFNQDTAGIAVIKKGSNSIQVSFKNEYKYTPIVNATLQVPTVQLRNGKSEDPTITEDRILSAGYSYVVSQISTKGFTIVLNQNAQDDLPFAWTALSVQTPTQMQTAESDARTASATQSASLIGLKAGLTLQSSESPVSGDVLGASDSAVAGEEVSTK